MHATEVLSHEHRIIEQVLDCLDRLVKVNDIKQQCDWNTASKILDFLRTFADRCHHGKEEEKLFPMLVARGLSSTMGPTVVMRDEHQQGRRLMTAMSNAITLGFRGDRSAQWQFAKAAKEYINLLRTHIQKEDHCLFPMAEQLLSETDQAELLSQFDAAENQPDMHGEHEKYLQLADDLAKKLGVPVAKVGATCRMPCCGHA
jgi:hemerythrin-like domain-containing protein